ncbi:aminoglycoside phosphotransferase family protein [Streptomyces sp. KM273126]|uniref:aminoglycoside phosphotransferase family protein n=1 Tax=Streptomyces sp. KM273126 TaxID=2545247 RepID=UPI0015EBD555|nr:aminoglycoside phosphotransferase family protein [Streptomyces sp. KM273126]MBA2809817.1 aminoglycoside phosphotransferase family protein [Streptomyces sp. KM273126]
MGGRPGLHARHAVARWHRRGPRRLGRRRGRPGRAPRRPARGSRPAGRGARRPACRAALPGSDAQGRRTGRRKPRPGRRVRPHAARPAHPARRRPAHRALPVLVHHALHGEHLVVSADGRVRGVLDWTGAVVGDPAEDIAGLAHAVGAPAAVRAATLAGYGARPCLRGLWLARCDTVLRLSEKVRGRDAGPLPLLRKQLRRAWEAILLERVTELRDGPDEAL